MPTVRQFSDHCQIIDLPDARFLLIKSKEDERKGNPTLPSIQLASVPKNDDVVFLFEDGPDLIVDLPPYDMEDLGNELAKLELDDRQVVYYSCRGGEVTRRTAGVLDFLEHTYPEVKAAFVSKRRGGGTFEDGSTDNIFDRGLGVPSIMRSLVSGGVQKLYSLQGSRGAKTRLDKLLLGDQLFSLLEKIQAGEEPVVLNNKIKFELSLEREIKDLSTGYVTMEGEVIPIEYNLKWGSGQVIPIEFITPNDTPVTPICPNKASNQFNEICRASGHVVADGRGDMHALGYQIKGQQSLARFFTRCWIAFFIAKFAEACDERVPIVDNQMMSSVVVDEFGPSSFASVILDMRGATDDITTTALLGLWGSHALQTDVRGSHLRVERQTGAVIANQEYNIPAYLPSPDSIQRAIWSLSGTTRQQASCAHGFRSALIACFLNVGVGMSIPIYARPDAYDQRANITAPPYLDDMSFAPSVVSMQCVTVGFIAAQYYGEVVREVVTASFDAKYALKPNWRGFSAAAMNSLALMASDIAEWVRRTIDTVLGVAGSVLSIQRWVRRLAMAGEFVSTPGCWASMLLGTSIPGQCSWFAQSEFTVPKSINPHLNRLDGSREEAAAYKEDVFLINTVELMRNGQKLVNCDMPAQYVEKYLDYNATTTRVIQVLGKRLKQKIRYISVVSHTSTLYDAMEGERLLRMYPSLQQKTKTEVRSYVKASHAAAVAFKDVPAKPVVTKPLSVESNIIRGVETNNPAVVRNMQQAKGRSFVESLGFLSARTEKEWKPVKPPPKTHEEQVDPDARLPVGDFFATPGTVSNLAPLAIGQSEYETLAKTVRLPAHSVRVYSMPGDGLCGAHAISRVSGHDLSAVTAWLQDRESRSDWFTNESLAAYCTAHKLNVVFLDREFVQAPGQNRPVARPFVVTGDGSDGVIIHGGQSNMHFYAGRSHGDDRAGEQGRLRMVLARAH